MSVPASTPMPLRDPWLQVPLAEYEGHMALPEVAQAQLLADGFECLLQRYTEFPAGDDANPKEGPRLGRTLPGATWCSRGTIGIEVR